jgi:dipeptidyl aminopeptidase/acylaminoacyl peptidase
MNVSPGAERQITRDPRGHVLTNTGVWSPDGQWIIYDTRSERPGTNFDGETIERVNVRTREVREVYRSTRGAHCGVVTFHPLRPEVVFIHGPEDPTPDWSYNAFHRQGVIVDVAHPGKARPLDARDVMPPFTPGALRGGSHVHVWDAAGDWVSFTYEDHVLAQFKEATADNDINLRNIGVSVPGHRVQVVQDHPRNHSSDYFTVLAARVVAEPRRGSDEIKKACEEGWVGTRGYLRADGSRQRRALAFQGTVVDAGGSDCVEVFVVDLPDDPTQAGQGPLAGSATRAPLPPNGAIQRRLTFTTGRRHPGVQGPRHWLRASPDGSQIAFLMRDDAGVVQLWTVSPNGGTPRQVTSNPYGISSCFSFSPDGRLIAHAMDNSVCVTEVATGRTRRVTPRSEGAMAPRPEACVFSPDGQEIAYLRAVPMDGASFNQVFVVTLKP